jgi:UDP-N-acetylmuramate dehydrogenase
VTDGPAGQFRVRENVSLAPFSTMGVGGNARYFVEATSDRELSEAIKWAREEGVPVFVLGGGSNVVFSDEGFPGLVLRMGLRGIKMESGGTDVRLAGCAGEDWDNLVRVAVDNELAGVECLAGIPGQVGASPIQNIGAYGQEVADTIAWVDAVDRSTGEPVSFTTKECKFGYRTSRFKTTDRDRYIITAVHYVLQHGGKPTVKYAELERYLAGHGAGSEPGLATVRDAVLAIRRSKAMVVDPNEPNSRSCGSFFTNPIVTQADFARVREITGVDTVPSFPAEEGHVKLSAAWLMERAGLQRGQRHGNVGLSERHVLAIVNCGGGSASEVLELAREVQRRVSDKFGVHLEPEPSLVGF